MAQSLARRQANGQIVQQGRPGSPAQITQSQLAQLGSVAVTAVVEMDSTYRQVEAYVGMGGAELSPSAVAARQDSEHLIQL